MGKRAPKVPPSAEEVLQAVRELARPHRRSTGSGSVNVPGGCTNDIARHLEATVAVGPVLRELHARGLVAIRQVGPYRCYIPTDERQEISA